VENRPSGSTPPSNFAVQNSLTGHAGEGFPKTAGKPERNHFADPTKPGGNKPRIHREPIDGAEDASEASMNHSIHSADRATHVKIVVMALVAGIAVAGVAISARTNVDYSQSARVIKAGKPVALTSSDTSVVR
jgi:hypothetical protein